MRRERTRGKTRRTSLQLRSDPQAGHTPSTLVADTPSQQDLTLPKSIITRLAKGVLPPNTQIQANAILALSKSAVVFINHLATTYVSPSPPPPTTKLTSPPTAPTSSPRAPTRKPSCPPTSSKPLKRPSTASWSSASKPSLPVRLPPPPLPLPTTKANPHPRSQNSTKPKPPNAPPTAARSPPPSAPPPPAAATSPCRCSAPRRPRTRKGWATTTTTRRRGPPRRRG